MIDAERQFGRRRSLVVRLVCIVALVAGLAPIVRASDRASCGESRSRTGTTSSATVYDAVDQHMSTALNCGAQSGCDSGKAILGDSAPAAGFLAARTYLVAAETTAIETPYGVAAQSATADAMAARIAVSNGATLYKGLRTGSILPPGESQFFALGDPASAGYGARYGIPPQNLPFDSVVRGTLRPGASFITREAPGVGPNGGGGIEVVINPGDFVPAGG